MRKPNGPSSSPVSRSDTGEVARPKAVTEGASLRIVPSLRHQLDAAHAPSVTPLRGAPPPPRDAQGRRGAMSLYECGKRKAGLALFERTLAEKH